MYILFDIGGTKMRVAFSANGMDFEEPVIAETPPRYEDGIAELKKAALDVAKGRKVQALAGGIAGPFSERKSSLVGSPNLKEWIGKPLRTDLEEAFQAPVYIENDSALVGLGEAVFGAGRGYDIVAYITVSTGVGGVRIVGGSIDEKSIGFEPGHQTIDADKSIIPNADGIYLGNMISGKGILNMTGVKPKDISDPLFWDKAAELLAYGLNNTIVHWSPDAVVLGGSMITGDPAIPLGKVEERLKQTLKIFPELPPLKKGELGDVGGLWGSLMHLAENHL